MKKEDWIKVTDRLPEAKYRTEEKGYSEGVLVFVKIPFGYRLTDAIYDYADEQWYGNHDDIIEGVTHWMPIISPEEN